MYWFVSKVVEHQLRRDWLLSRPYQGSLLSGCQVVAENESSDSWFDEIPKDSEQSSSMKQKQKKEVSCRMLYSIFRETFYLRGVKSNFALNNQELSFHWPWYVVPAKIFAWKTKPNNKMLNIRSSFYNRNNELNEGNEVTLCQPLKSPVDLSEEQTSYLRDDRFENAAIDIIHDQNYKNFHETTGRYNLAEWPLIFMGPQISEAKHWQINSNIYFKK